MKMPTKLSSERAAHDDNSRLPRRRRPPTPPREYLSRLDDEMGRVLLRSLRGRFEWRRRRPRSPALRARRRFRPPPARRPMSQRTPRQRFPRASPTVLPRLSSFVYFIFIFPDADMARPFTAPSVRHDAEMYFPPDAR